MRKFTLYMMITFGLLSIIQYAINAANNGGIAEYPFTIGRYQGVIRWTNDSDGALISSASTGVFTYTGNPDNDEDTIINWSSSARVEYTGEHDDYEGEYDLKAEILGAYSQSLNGNTVGELSEKVGFYIEMSPPPDGVTPIITDCESYGDADGENPTTNVTSSTRSEIPW
ncbi:hypothetical protein C6497_12300 [Candidatus Poribacteria bacterium]|nr:MAG: hypothetical protein C6497_12300 [Candidatus Poribacteria bacterium]